MVSRSPDVGEPDVTGLERWAAVVDVGGSSLKCGAVSDSGAVTGESSASINNAGSAEQLLENLASASTSALEAAPVPCEALGIAFPAPFDYSNGRPLLKHKFGSIYGLDLAQSMRISAAVKHTFFCNDAVAAGLGEAVHGSGDSSLRQLMITLGTGLGACLIEGGVPVTGGEADDVPNLYLRRLGSGTADDAFSARGLASRLQTTMSDLPAEIRRSNTEHDHQLDQFGRDLGNFLAPVVEATNTELVVVGGGASAAFDLFGEALVQALPVEVRRAVLGSSAALLGTASHVFAQLELSGGVRGG